MLLQIIDYTPRKLQAVAYRICAKILELDWSIKSKYFADYDNDETGERESFVDVLEFTLPSVTLENFNERVESLKTFLMGFKYNAPDTQAEFYKTLTLTLHTSAGVIADVYNFELAPVYPTGK